jgi:hypothetical protein
VCARPRRRAMNGAIEQEKALRQTEGLYLSDGNLPQEPVVDVDHAPPRQLIRVQVQACKLFHFLVRQAVGVELVDPELGQPLQHDLNERI